MIKKQGIMKPKSKNLTDSNLISLLRSDIAGLWAFSQYEETKCSKNDAHLTRFDWADWLEETLTYNAKKSSKNRNK